MEGTFTLAQGIDVVRLISAYFLDKEYILISRRYQLHPASATT
jgi:hypothetical protein